MLPKKITQKHTKVVPPHYRLCTRLVHPQHQPPEEDLSHILTRQRLLPDLLNLVATYDTHHGLLSEPTDETLTQFILDSTSLNLPSNCRISARHPLYSHIARHCSDITYAIHKDRTRQLQTMGSLP